MLPCVYFALPDRSRGFKTVDFRHLNVHQNQIKALFFHSAQHLRAVFRNRDGVSHPFQHPGGNLLVDGVVFGKKYPESTLALPYGMTGYK